MKDVVILGTEIQGTASIGSPARGSKSPKSKGSHKITPKSFTKRDDLQIAFSKDNTEGYQSSADGGVSGRVSKIFKPTMSPGRQIK